MRYRVPFRDVRNNRYEVEVYRDGYTGAAEELTGGVSCFEVSGTDDDFVYTPVRTSTATLRVTGDRMLTDLYSINNQYAKVRLLKNGALEWTGYVKPEQYTQPYTNTAGSVEVECVCALGTLENMVYDEAAEGGYISLMSLLRRLVARANGGYRGVYVAHVYGKNSTMMGNVLDDIRVCEENFIGEEMTLMEVLEAVCKFLGWTAWDMGGYLWLADADWRGDYRLYDEGLTSYETVRGNEVTVQDVGYNGSDGNTLDVVHGYNRASVKSVNNVFDNPVEDEPFDALKPLNKGAEPMKVTGYYAYKGKHMAARKKFLKPMLWKLTAWKTGGVTKYTAGELSQLTGAELNMVDGALLMYETNYETAGKQDETPAESVNDFNEEATVQIRILGKPEKEYPAYIDMDAVTMEGKSAVYADCAISINCKVEGYGDIAMMGPTFDFDNQELYLRVECGGKWYNGSEWVSERTVFAIEVEEGGQLKSNKTPYTPYNLSGYIIPIEFIVGRLTVTILRPRWKAGEYYCTGVKIRNLTFGYAKREDEDTDGEDGDRVYANTVNEAYMSEAEEITFEIGSYNADGATYSKALLSEGWVTDNLYCAIAGRAVRPEEMMIRRIVNRYGETKIKLTEAIRMTSAITPLTVLRERTQAGKTFRLLSGEWDYEQDRLRVIMEEDTE